MSFPSRPPPARAAYRGFVKGGQSERGAGEDPVAVRSMPALYAKDEDDTEDAITVVKTVEKEEKRKPHSPSRHGRDSKSHNRDRNEKKKEANKDKEKEQGSRDQGIRGQSGKDLSSKNILPADPRVGRVHGGRDQASKEKGGRDRSRSPVARGGGKEAGQLREEARMGFNIGRKPQIRQSKAKEGESQREKPGERELVQPASRGKWEGFGWSSRNTGEELGQVSDDSDD
eukprot:TRINITY_DN2245_c0_g1_i2.p1 TRINITY_DN2245_c0_g1~~TRINITY_DN2245_c0_g1_i2.p1  ORF type:complete len:229 (+),score=67.94 TRINITY_DN2245_c0_g1_i2:109-795(+)